MANMLFCVPDFFAITIYGTECLHTNGAGLDLQSRVNFAIPGGETGYLARILNNDDGMFTRGVSGHKMCHDHFQKFT